MPDTEVSRQSKQKLYTRAVVIFRLFKQASERRTKQNGDDTVSQNASALHGGGGGGSLFGVETYDFYDQDADNDRPTSKKGGDSEAERKSDRGGAQEEYDVEEILDRSGFDGDLQYRVKWKGEREKKKSWKSVRIRLEFHICCRL